MEYMEHIIPDNKCLKNYEANFDSNSYVDSNRCKCQSTFILLWWFSKKKHMFG